MRGPRFLLIMAGMMDLMSLLGRPIEGCVAGTRHENGHGFIGGIE